MFIKKSKCVLSDMSALNEPRLLDFYVDYHIKPNAEAIEFVKTSSEQKSGDSVPVFNIEAEIKEHPNSLYVKCFAIKADEMNDNGDYFSKDELKKSYGTFVGVPVFTNHQNNDIEKARGKVVHSWWDENKNGIMVIMRVDAEAYPQFSRLITEKIATSTSMGASVSYSICSVCHNYAEEPTSYCNCIKERKTRNVTAKKQKCHYHKNGREEHCPVCKGTKKEAKVFDYDGKAFEYNFGIKFIENSLVTTPACHSCGITDIIDVNKMMSKISDISARLPNLLKAASQQNSCIKIAGQKEITDLNQALELISNTCQIMLKQKNQLDLEFVSDLVKVLADLQKATDELTEQGYGRLQGGETNTPSPTGQPQQITNAVQPEPAQVDGKVQSGPAGSVGTVTSPVGASRSFNLEKKALLNNNIKLSFSLIKDKIFKINLMIKNNKKLTIPFKLSK